MLQFLVETNEEYSVAEQVQMAIEAGCGWIHLRLPDLDDAAVREISGDIISMCRDAGTILTIDDRYELAKELSIHGVLLNNPEAYGNVSPISVREILGPEAIIGITAGTPSTVVSLRGKDIDYAVISPSISATGIKEFVDAVREAEVQMPLVACGNIVAATLKGLLSDGVNGVLAGPSIISGAPDPVEAIKQFLATA